MPIQYQPFPEFQVPNVNLMGSFAQGAALQNQALQEERLRQQMELAEKSAVLAGNRDIRQAEQAAAETKIKDFDFKQKVRDYALKRMATVAPGDQKGFLNTLDEFKEIFPEEYSSLKDQTWNEDLRNRLLLPTEKLVERKYEKGPEGSGALLETSIGKPPKYVFPIDPEQQRIMEREGTGKNPMSSARGVGQFIDSTFVDTYRKTFPSQAKGLTDARILAQRGTIIDGQTPIEVPMLNTFTRENKNALARANLEPTPGNTRLAHFLGAGGAIDVLKANPNTPVESLVSQDAIQANPTVLRGKTAGQVAAWANKQMEGAGELTPSKFEPLGSNKREAQDGALEFLRAFEYDPETGENRPAQLLAQTKGGQINRIFQDIGSRFGIGSEAYDAEGRLSVAGRQALLAKVGGSLGGKSFTDEDRKFVMDAIGGLDDSSKDVGFRMARLDEAMRMMARVAKVPYKPAPELERVRGIFREAPVSRGQAGEAPKAKPLTGRIKFMELGD
jgi:hypothetical protein